MFMALLALGACEPSATVTDVETRSLALPPGGELRGLAIVVPNGRALGFVAQPMEAQETLKQQIELEPADPAMLTVYRTTKKNQFVVTAHAPGNTLLEILDSRGNATGLAFAVEVTP